MKHSKQKNLIGINLGCKESDYFIIVLLNMVMSIFLYFYTSIFQLNYNTNYHCSLLAYSLTKHLFYI